VIGVSVKNGQLAVVEEFFELFKTPWEVYEPGGVYDVVIATRSDMPLPDADLVVACGPGRSSVDGPLGIAEGTRHRSGTVIHQGMQVPVYGELLTFLPAASEEACVPAIEGVAGVSVRRGGATVLRIGYDLFEEVRFLLTTGQPVEHAAVPTLDLHVDMLRSWIRQAGIGVVEIPPVPAGYPLSVCLTHDIDFVGIRDHKFDHSMFGFLLRATFGSVRNVLRGRLTLRKLFRTWRAAASLPLVYLGWIADFWEPFEWYLTVEKGLGATYFLIPFKGRPGDRHSGSAAARRATRYDVTTIQDAVHTLVETGCEVGVHGIDAWHDADKGRAERLRVTGVSGASDVGIRMHWLLRDGQTPRVLDDAGYLYDSTGGYNETIGYRHGTAQVFRPLDSRTMLELPMHIQDGALFFPDRLDLSETEAWRRTSAIVSQTQALGGVLTLLWHDRSHGPERYWGDFYIRLVQDLRSRGAWFATAGELTRWFAARRAIRFERTGTGKDAHVRLRCDSAPMQPPFTVRLRHASDATSAVVDAQWTGASPLFVAPRRRDSVSSVGSAVVLPQTAGGC